MPWQVRRGGVQILHLVKNEEVGQQGHMKERKDLKEMKEHTIHSGGGHFHRGDSEDPGMPQGLLGQKSRCCPCNLVIEGELQCLQLDEHGSGH